MDNIDTIIQEIKATQIKNMKIPPKHQNFFTDLGLFLLHYKRFTPDTPIQLIDCEYFGLYPLDEEDIALTVKADFQIEGTETIISTKGYLIPTDPMKQLDSVPSKGDKINIDIQIPSKLVTIQENNITIALKKGRYKEQFLPLLLNDYQSIGY
ncbi:MAG: hypothetical protein COB02_13600 [Candidatus Cloacimonadota bacterium]|nr:MAG: hypothetical protein COB02_13600 [Candidatus Cloacimonadota bacterium]